MTLSTYYFNCDRISLRCTREIWNEFTWDDFYDYYDFNFRSISQEIVVLVTFAAFLSH